MWLYSYIQGPRENSPTRRKVRRCTRRSFMPQVLAEKSLSSPVYQLEGKKRFLILTFISAVHLCYCLSLCVKIKVIFFFLCMPLCICVEHTSMCVYVCMCLNILMKFFPNSSGLLSPTSFDPVFTVYLSA